MSQLVNPHQQMKIAIVLRDYEEDLRLAKSLLNGYVEDAVLYRKQIKIPANYQPALLERIDEALFLIEQLANDLDLTQTEEDLSRIIMAKMNIDWVNLSDSLAKNLKGFGSVDPNLHAVLDDKLERMAEIAMELGFIFAKGIDKKVEPPNGSAMSSE